MLLRFTSDRQLIQQQKNLKAASPSFLVEDLDLTIWHSKTVYSFQRTCKKYVCFKLSNIPTFYICYSEYTPSIQKQGYKTKDFPC